MASIITTQLPCDGEGICMVCKTTPSEAEILTCSTCVTPWHVSCLSTLPANLQSTLQWECPDCTAPPANVNPVLNAGPSNGLVAATRAIEADSTLSETEKARRRQQLLSGKADSSKGPSKRTNEDDYICSCCFQLMEKPVTIPCAHHLCLSCFKKWTGQGKNTCVKCRQIIPRSMILQPRINVALVVGIRKTKALSNGSTVAQFVHDQEKPDEAYRSERAKRGGRGNACSGRIKVTVKSHHFGPILAEHDPERKTGVSVGSGWEFRLECRQWGIHFPHIAGISGKANYGAQSVVLSGGYLDDEDHGDWFLYTGSGGRDLTGNKRTNKVQSFDQTFHLCNEALRVSCKKGYPVRVVRSHKERRSSYAPVRGLKGLRYDGIYRIEKCWRKMGTDGFKVCRYLFIRCDNEPAPWSSDGRGDVVRALPDVPELEDAIDIFERNESPMWDYDNEDGKWKWTRPPPVSPKKSASKNKIPNELCCLKCKKMMVSPVTTPCACNFCKGCLQSEFAGMTLFRERSSAGGRSLRTRKNPMKCPSCHNDIAEFVQHLPVNKELESIIESLLNPKVKDEEPVEAEEDEEEKEDEEEEYEYDYEYEDEDEEDGEEEDESAVENDNSEAPAPKRAKVE
ncbi:E3 ubiquitin-protein ligase ORTHRUS 2-like [Impatiens glandulifera]|uniref:E3 ubiquitin-protein ligase ORTHRUS 2-like n=1 Tax=Impatiens glandulifera TaxID=253017 RepID=UPI001FB0AFD5|nr:E3 ubiquitin-protein ligase ORTHRUS 2-like [Impatiens glandulifera]